RACSRMLLVLSLRNTLLHPFAAAATARVISDRGGRPMWIRRTSNFAPSHSLTASTQLDFPDPSPPTNAIKAPPFEKLLRDWAINPAACIAASLITVNRRQ